MGQLDPALACNCKMRLGVVLLVLCVSWTAWAEKSLLSVTDGELTSSKLWKTNLRLFIVRKQGRGKEAS